MADLIQKVILEVEVNTGELINEQVKLRQSIEGVKGELDKLRDQRKIMEEWKQSTEAVDKDIVKLEGTLRNLNTQQKNLQKQVDISTKANQAQSGSYEQLLRQWQLAEIQLKTLQGTLKQNEDGTFALTEEYRAQSKAVGDAKEALDTFNLTISDGRTNVGQYGKALEPIKAELKELNQTQVALNKTMLGLNALQEASTQVLGENTVANNTLKSAISAMVVVQNLGNIRQGVTASLMLATQVQSKALTAATVAQTTATGLFAGVQTFLQIQLGLSAAAARAFAVAIAATGIGALVVALGLAVSAITSYLTRTKEATKETDTWAKTIEDATKSFKASIDLLNTTVDEGNKKIFDNLQTQIELVKLRGGTLTQVYNMEAALIDRRLEFLKKSGNADTAQYQELLNDKLVLTSQYFNDLEQQQGEALGRQFQLAKENQLLVEEALAAVDPATQLAALVDAAMLEAEINATTQKEITEDQRKESEERKKIAQQESDYKIALVSAEATLEATRASFIQSGASQLRGFVKENGEAYKALFLTEQAAAIAEVIIQLNAEVARIAAANAVLGVAGIPLTIAQTATAKIRAGIGIASIAGQTFKQFTPKAEHGAMFTIGGKPHSQGGTQFWGEDGSHFEAEKDELLAVVNKRSTGMLGSLSWLNQLGGGVDFFKNGGLHHLADGGFAARAISDPVINSFNTDQLVTAIQNLDIVVRVSDINSVNSKLLRVSERGTI